MGVITNKCSYSERKQTSSIRGKIVQLVQHTQGEKVFTLFLMKYEIKNLTLPKLGSYCHNALYTYLYLPI